MWKKATPVITAEEGREGKLFFAGKFFHSQSNQFSKFRFEVTHTQKIFVSKIYFNSIFFSNSIFHINQLKGGHNKLCVVYVVISECCVIYTILGFRIPQRIRDSFDFRRARNCRYACACQPITRYDEHEDANSALLLNFWYWYFCQQPILSEKQIESAIFWHFDTWKPEK